VQGPKKKKREEAKGNEGPTLKKTVRMYRPEEDKCTSEFAVKGDLSGVTGWEEKKRRGSNKRGLKNRDRRFEKQKKRRHVGLWDRKP